MGPQRGLHTGYITNHVGISLRNCLYKLIDKKKVCPSMSPGLHLQKYIKICNFVLKQLQQQNLNTLFLNENLIKTIYRRSNQGWRNVSSLKRCIFVYRCCIVKHINNKIIFGGSVPSYVIIIKYLFYNRGGILYIIDSIRSQCHILPQFSQRSTYSCFTTDVWCKRIHGK